MFKNVLLPIKFDCFVRWVVGVGVLTWGERCTPEGEFMVRVCRRIFKF